MAAAQLDILFVVLDIWQMLTVRPPLFILETEDLGLLDYMQELYILLSQETYHPHRQKIAANFVCFILVDFFKVDAWRFCYVTGELSL